MEFCSFKRTSSPHFINSCRIIPWVGKVVEHHFQSQAMLEGALDGRDFRSGFVEAAGLAAIAAVRGHKPPSAPTCRPGGLRGEAGQLGMGGLGVLHDHFHYSEGTVQQHIQDPESRGRRDIKCSLSFLSQPITIIDNYLLLMADTNKINNKFTFLYFKMKFITCSI